MNNQRWIIIPAGDFTTIFGGSENTRHNNLTQKTRATYKDYTLIVTKCPENDYIASYIVSTKPNKEALNYSHTYLIDAKRIDQAKMATLRDCKSFEEVDSLPQEVTDFLNGTLNQPQSGPQQRNQPAITQNTPVVAPQEKNDAAVVFDNQTSTQDTTDPQNSALDQQIDDLRSKGEQILKNSEENNNQGIEVKIDFIKEFEAATNMQGHIYDGKAAQNAFFLGLAFTDLKRTVKSEKKHGAWGPFIADNFPKITLRSIQRYMKLSRQPGIKNYLNAGLDRCTNLNAVIEESKSLNSADEFFSMYKIPYNPDNFQEMTATNKKIDAATFVHKHGIKVNDGELDQIVQNFDECKSKKELDDFKKDLISRQKIIGGGIASVIERPEEKKPNSDLFIKAKKKLVSTINAMLKDENHEADEETDIMIDELMDLLKQLRSERHNIQSQQQPTAA